MSRWPPPISPLLFNLAFAKAHGGEFILRIEDTDQTRSTVQSEQMILDALCAGSVLTGQKVQTSAVHMHRIAKANAKTSTNNTPKNYWTKVMRGPLFATAEELDQMRAEQMARGETQIWRSLCEPFPWTIGQTRRRRQAILSFVCVCQMRVYVNLTICYVGSRDSLVTSGYASATQNRRSTNLPFGKRGWWPFDADYPRHPWRRVD